MVAEMQNSEKIKENNKMNYTVLNEELGIYACHVGDLTGKEAGKFLEKFPDSPLSSMIIYYKPEEDIILVNADCVYKDTLIDLIMLYLTGKDQEIDDYVYDHKALDWIVEAAQVLFEIRCIRAVARDSRKGEKICEELDICLNVGEIRDIHEKECDTFEMMLKTYYVGVARGYEAKKRTT